MSCTVHANLNYVSDILDEIALEGLDGITLEALWMRLSVRSNFMFSIDENSKKFLWNIIIKLKDLKFYEIPEARPSLKYHDYSTTDENTCNEIRIELDEVYPYSSVKNVPGIFGSCQHYATRVDITKEVVALTVEEAESKWGNWMVVVASQSCRNAALIDSCCTPNIDFSNSPLNYEILERIGRCRQIGSLTCGKGSLQTLVTDVKSIFHYLKCLMNHKLVKKQSLLGSLSSNSHASLVYLTRFFEESANENFNILKMAVEELKSRPPHYMMPCNELYALFETSKKKRIRKYKTSVMFRKYIEVTPCVPYRAIYSDASPAEWEKKSKTGEKMMRCFKLINPDVELSDIVEKECDSDEEEGNSGFLPKGIYYKNMPIAFQAYHHIKNAGAKGLSHTELGQIMGLNKYFIRGLIKRLSGDKLCKFYFETEGRRRSKRYMVGDHVQTKEAASEIVQILSESTQQPEWTEQTDQETALPLEGDASEEKQKISVPALQEENWSYRGLKRIGLIIKTIKTHRFRLFHQIKKFVHEEEKKEGLTITVDRQTIQKLLKKLEDDGLIKKFIFSGKENTENSIKIYTDPTFEPDEKFKESFNAFHSTCSLDPEPKEDGSIVLQTEFSTALIENLSQMERMLEGIDCTLEKPKQECNITYMYSPKFMRLNTLHDFMFHLVYDYAGVREKSQEELLEALSRTTTIEEDVKKEMPSLYGTEPSTYMFVPPLSYSGKTPGWFLMSDLLTRMPLAVMVKVIKVIDNCPQLWNYLHHPIRKYLLVKDLPLEIRRVFFCRKNQISNFYCDIRRLCFMGLLQFGPKFGKKAYQSALYLNRKASLLDTTFSPPAYLKVPSDLEFTVKRYLFQTRSDLNNYWMDLFDICMGTKLGEKDLMTGNEAVVERDMTKELLKKYIEPKSVEQALEDDNGEIPGDHLGAAGLDSCLFSFFKNNWTGSATKNFPKKLYPKKVSKKPVPMLFPKIKRTSWKSEKQRKRFGNKKIRRKPTLVSHAESHTIPKAEDGKAESANVEDGTSKEAGGVEEDSAKEANVEEGSEKEFKVEEPKEVKGKAKSKVQEQSKDSKRLRKPSYDEADLEALKLMNSLRVTWSPAEDNLLLLCRVAMSFLCPNPKTFAKIPQTEVRRALQRYLPEARDKTQRATARRLVYMLKNPATVRSVNLCLEKLKEMPESRVFQCAELAEKIKPSAHDLSERQEEFYQKFHELVAFLKDRFIDNPNSYPGKDNNDLIPDSLEEFLDKFLLETPVNEEVDISTIRENVIRSTLMSSLCCRSDKTSSALQLFDIYRQYNENELQNAVRDLHQNKVITLSKKSGSSVFKSGNILPLTFSPFKLSFAFQHMFNTKYSHSIYPESYSQVSKFLQANLAEEIELDLNECNVAVFLLGCTDVLSFRPVLPDQIIALEKGDLSDSTYSKMVMKYCRMLEYNQPESKVVCTFGKVISKGGEVSGGEGRKRRSSEGEGEGEGVDAKKMRREGEGEGEREGEGAEQGSERKTRSSRVMLYMMREEAKKDARQELSGRLVEEFCVVRSSKVFVKLKRDELEKYVKKMDEKSRAAIIRNIVSRSLYPINLIDESLVISCFPEKHLIPALERTLNFITSRKELGATVEDLKLNCGHEMLASFLQTLTELKLIIKSGIQETRYVSQKYGTPWLLSSFKIKRIEREKLKPNEAIAVALTGSSSEEDHPRRKVKGIIELKSEEFGSPCCLSSVSNKIKVIIRPWIRIDGSLNRKVLDRFLGTILGFVMLQPGCSLRQIADKFVPSITPVWTKDLVEILLEIGCLTLKTFVVTEKATLFTKSRVELLDEYTGLESSDCVIVEATADAVNILGLFIGKKTYSKDFLSD